jgi:CHAT domain-containing protein
MAAGMRIRFRRLLVLRVKRTMRLRMYLRGLAVLALGALLASGAWAQAEKLALHQPVERESGPGQTDVFTVDVAARQFLHVLVEKKGVDVVLVLADPEGKPLVTADSPNRGFGPEPASLIADRGGAYQVRVAKSPRSSEAGHYRIELTELHSPTAQDRTRLQAETEFYAAAAAAHTEDKQQAIAGYQRAAALWHALRDGVEEALCLHRTGVVYAGLDRQKALDYYNRALRLRRAVKDRAGEAATLNNIGLVYKDLGEHQKALEYFVKGLAGFRAVEDRMEEEAALNSIGEVYADLGEKQKALSNYNLSLAASRAAGDHATEAAVLTNAGRVYGDLGEKQKALDYYQQALPLLRATGDPGEATTLNNIGSLYLDLGEKQKALDYFNQALPVFRAAGDRAGEAMALTNIGLFYGDLGEKQKALDYCNQALPLARAAGDREREAEILDAMGQVYADMGEKRKALDSYNQALPLERAVGNRAAEAETLNDIGKGYADLGDKQKALRHYVQALRLARAVSDPARQGLVLSNLLSYWQAEHNPGLAIFFGKQAVNQYQQIRRGNQGLEPQLQRTYLATVTEDYRHLADLLIAQGRLAEAEQVLGLLKEEEYFDYVRRDASEASTVNGGADLNPEEAASDKHYREIAGKLGAIGAERGDLLAKQNRTPAETKRMEQLEKDIVAANVAFEKFLNELPERFSAKPAAVQDLRETQGIMEDLREMPAGTVAIYTLVGEDKFRAILRTPDVQKAYEYPIPAGELNHQVAEFRRVVKNPKLDPRPLAEELYKIVIGPMAEDLRQAKAQTLMWSLDGVLRYLPLAALYDGKQYLVEQYRVSVVTLASNTRLLGRPDPGWKAAGFGVTKAFAGAPALPSVSAELAGIIAAKPGDAGVMPGEIEMDEAFTQQAMRRTLHKRYTVVHISSHFRFQPGNETQSFLLLGDGSHLSMDELKTSVNLFGGVQLLTLSACNTGLGDGTEVEGFGTLAQRQGAKAVIASLWPVADASTSLLMQKFYKIRESSPGKTKLEALQEAQLELLRGVGTPAPDAAARRTLAFEPENEPPSAGPFPFDRKVPYAHPYYWAPFFLMGNWL